MKYSDTRGPLSIGDKVYIITEKEKGYLITQIEIDKIFIHFEELKLYVADEKLDEYSEFYESVEEAYAIVAKKILDKAKN